MAKFIWTIHFIANGMVCDRCKKVETGYLPYTCNAHTHGMEKYNHMDFQIVLMLPDNEIPYILNTLAHRVQEGERFLDGDMVSGIYEDCDIRLDEYEETGRKVLRVMIPDDCNVFPEEEHCMPVFRLQLLETEDLHNKNWQFS